MQIDKEIKRKPITLGFSVEGITEAFFVQYVLARYLANFNIIVQSPVVLGGNVTIDRVAHSLFVLSKQNDFVTSLHDYYGFKLPYETPKLLIDEIEKSISNHHLLTGITNVLPYLQKYEFEALLFSDIPTLCKHIYHNPEKQALCEVDFFNNLGSSAPEDVNNSVYTAPSKRIIKIQKRYKKSISGFLIAQDIGIENIRLKCPRFSAWIDRIISLNA